MPVLIDCHFSFMVCFLKFEIISLTIAFSCLLSGFPKTEQYREVIVASLWSSSCELVYLWHSWARRNDVEWIESCRFLPTLGMLFPNWGFKFYSLSGLVSIRYAFSKKMWIILSQNVKFPNFTKLSTKFFWFDQGCFTGRNRVWCLYPNKNAVTESVKDIVGCSTSPESQAEPVICMPHYFRLKFVIISYTKSHLNIHPMQSFYVIYAWRPFQLYAKRSYCNVTQANKEDVLHFILIDGTWSNSAAMVKRLQVWS